VRDAIEPRHELQLELVGALAIEEGGDRLCEDLRPARAGRARKRLQPLAQGPREEQLVADEVGAAHGQGAQKLGIRSLPRSDPWLMASAATAGASGSMPASKGAPAASSSSSSPS